MVHDSSLAAGAGDEFAFDLESQAGITHLLASLRASDIDVGHKNELRDLIFLYTNGGKDRSVKLDLEEKLTAYKVTPLSKKAEIESVDPGYDFEFGTVRLAPSFKAPKIVPKSEKPTPEKTTTEESKESNETPVPDPASVKPVVMNDPEPASQPKSEKSEPTKPKSVVEPVAVPPVEPKVVTAPAADQSPAASAEPVTPVPPSVKVSEPAPAPADLPTEIPEPAPPVAEIKPAKVPVASAAPVTPDVSSYTTPDQNLQRIREIKSLVNDKVGNPVNLIDINNEVGREYMTALLDAMKKLNSGTSTISAMKRLEEAYSTVEKTIEEHNAGKEKEPEPAPPAQQPESNSEAKEQEMVQPEPVAKITPVPVKDNSPSAPQPVARTASQKPTPDLATPKPDKVVEPAPLTSKIKPLSAVSTPTPKPTPAPKTAVVPKPDSGTTPVKVVVETAKPVSKSPQKPETTAQPKSQPVPVATNVPKNVAPSVPSAPTPVASLAKSEVKPLTPEDLPSAAEVETSSVTGDDLFTKEVDDGLQQLLSEWIIFKKSGLFGTGPKGREHPLFMKMKDLQIPLLLAGRFEGATQEVKQSLTDYMNGWRYEQGIIYEQGETFDHYLRRVIRHILDLQNRKRG